MRSATTGTGTSTTCMLGPRLPRRRPQPEARFTSDSVDSRQRRRYEARGKLTIRDVTRDVALPFTCASRTASADRARQASASSGSTTASAATNGRRPATSPTRSRSTSRSWRRAHEAAQLLLGARYAVRRIGARANPACGRNGSAAMPARCASIARSRSRTSIRRRASACRSRRSHALRASTSSIRAEDGGATSGCASTAARCRPRSMARPCASARDGRRRQARLRPGAARAAGRRP